MECVGRGTELYCIEKHETAALNSSSEASEKLVLQSADCDIILCCRERNCYKHSQTFVCCCVDIVQSIGDRQSLVTALPHPPSGPNLAPTDFHFFNTLKALHGTSFEDNERVINAVKMTA